MPKRKLLQNSASNPIIGPSIEELFFGDFPILQNSWAKALWLKENAAETSKSFAVKVLVQQTWFLSYCKTLKE